MLTLNKATNETRTILKVLLIIIAIAFAFLIIAKIAALIKNIVIPPQPAKPTMAYGKLPKISFTTSTINTKFTFSIDTISGSLPTFPSLVKIYKVSTSQPNLLSLNNAKGIVANDGFNSNPLRLSDKLYQWFLPVGDTNFDVAKQLTMNIYSLNFDLNSTYLNNPVVLTGANLPAPADAIQVAQDFLDQMSLFPGDIDSTKTVPGLFSINSLNLVPATSFSTTQIIRVDFFQKNLDGIPIVYSSPFGSSMSFLIAGGSQQGQVVEAHFSHSEWSNNDYATYPIKSSQQLFNDLVQGKGNIIAYEGSLRNITITDAYLAYYIDQNQKFFMPIMVFKGNNNFYAYLSAVNDQWVEN